MQCPSCGFENMPGQQQCVVCSTTLLSGPTRENVLPPRAKNRTLMQRINASSAGFLAANSWVNDFRMRRARAGQNGRLWNWLNPRTLGLILASSIPGFGHAFLLNQRLTGLSIFLASVLSLATAIILYRSPISDMLVWSVLAASVLSMCDSIYRLRGHIEQLRRRYYSYIGICLLVISLYTGTYTVLRIALDPIVTVVTVIDRIPAGVVSRNDKLLLSRLGSVMRGDLIVGTITGQNIQAQFIRPVIGMPGDQIVVSDRLYVNGRPVQADLPLLAENHGEPRPYTEQERAELTLRAGEYWVVPNFNYVPDTATLVRVGKIRRTDIRGRVVAITSPLEHRRILRRN